MKILNAHLNLELQISDRLSLYQGDSLKALYSFPKDSVDLIICDGPYGVTTHTWDKISNIQEFNLQLIKIYSEILRPGGTLYLFGKHDCLDFIDYHPYLNLISRIIWYQPSRLSQGKKKYTNNYDIIACFTKGLKNVTFNIDDIRVPQMVELTHRKRCENVPSVQDGTYSKTKYNKKGKNPGDVWGDIKQLTYKSKELVNRKYLNTIQKPESLIKRCILASSNPNDLVLDPFMGVGTSAIVCLQTNRRFIGIELNHEYIISCKERLKKDPTK